jgi:hypothetical protein
MCETLAKSRRLTIPKSIRLFRKNIVMTNTLAYFVLGGLFYKAFYGHEFKLLTVVFVNKSSHPCLILTGKAEAYPSGATYGIPRVGSSLAKLMIY